MKRIVILLIILFMPINVLAISDYVYVGGQSLGINVNTDGILVVGFYKVNGKYNKGSEPLKNGDYITHINNEEVTTADDMTKKIEKYVKDEKVLLTFTRGGKKYQTTLPLLQSEGKYKTGLYVKSSIKGIGTLVFIDPESLTYCALGHEITQNEASGRVEIKSGEIFDSYITSVSKSTPGVAGSKNARLIYDAGFGTIEKNTKYGIYGKYTSSDFDDTLIKVNEDIKIGDAYIKTVLEGNKVENFLIEITSINENSEVKNITFKIKDERLINYTGGVVQGMSGSPIIQNDTLVGALTHVIVDNPTMGYGILIKTLVREAENN